MRVCFEQADPDKRRRYDHAGEEGVDRGPSIFDFDGSRKKVGVFERREEESIRVVCLIFDQRGDNYVRELGVDLEALYTGFTKTVKLHKRVICPTCSGVGECFVFISLFFHSLTFYVRSRIHQQVSGWEMPSVRRFRA